MTENLINESLLQVFLFESDQLIEQLEQIILEVDGTATFSNEDINTIFRIMHTIKGSSAMMQFNQISKVSHFLEDIFAYLRANDSQMIDYSSLIDHILEGIDFIKEELEKIKNGQIADGSAQSIIERSEQFLINLQGKEGSDEDVPLKKQAYSALIFFSDGCEMENIRAFNVVHNLEDIAEDIHHIPEDLINTDESLKMIREQGFNVQFKSHLDYKQIEAHLLETIYLSRLELNETTDDSQLTQEEKPKTETLEINGSDNQVKNSVEPRKEALHSNVTSMISVNVSKLDKLMDIVGEIVVAEALVIQNPDIQNLSLENFQKASRQLHKIISELQDSVLSLRMVPLKSTFNKMNRIVRDMKKKLNKDVQLELIGEDTEVDKNIIEHISDPLMHLIRNAIDHGLETLEERIKTGKAHKGIITLEAKSSGSDVFITVNDDGKGLDREKIIVKAKEKGLLSKEVEDMADREIYKLILQPGFSTKDEVTEFSGRGVGMDVAVKNIEALGGEISIDSQHGIGTQVTIRIPLTLAIMEGMNIRVGDSRYTIPISAIKESFRPQDQDLITDPNGSEWMLVRGEVLKVIRLNELFHVDSSINKIEEGIMILVEEKNEFICILADELLGEQQVVVKAMPNFIKNMKKIKGMSGCTLLGDGSISLILDFSDMVS